jgi:hypothetical protein
MLRAKNNVVQPDGRINLGYDGDRTIAISINPRKPNLMRNVEPMLRDLVAKLNSKHYFTISSCQSHGPDFECFIAVAVTSAGYATVLSGEILSGMKKWPFVEVRRPLPHEFINTSVEVGRDLNVVPLKVSEEGATEAINNVLELGFPRYHMVNIVIRRKARNLLEELLIRLYDKLLLQKAINKVSKLLDGVPENTLMTDDMDGFIDSFDLPVVNSSTMEMKVTKSEVDHTGMDDEEYGYDGGDIMTLDEFVGCCEAGGFIDDDGIGYYSDSDKNYKVGNEVCPSDITSGRVDRKFTHVVWFNK